MVITVAVEAIQVIVEVANGRVDGKARVYQLVHVVVMVEVCVGIRYPNTITMDTVALHPWCLGLHKMLFVISVANLVTLSVFVSCLVVVEILVVDVLVVVVLPVVVLVDHVGVQTCL